MSSTIQTHTFPNGFRVIYEKHYNNMDIADIHLYVRLGSMQETDKTRGVSHFIEHMCFKGTKNLPSSINISSIFDKMGAILNASTHKQYTYYNVYVQRKYTAKCLQTLSDMLLHSVFDRGECEKELNVVIEENIKDNIPQYMMLEQLDNMMYEGTPYYYSIDTLSYHKGKNAKYLEDYDAVFDVYKTFYVPHNMVLSIVSSAPFREIVKTLENTEFIKDPRFKSPQHPLLNHVPFPIIPNRTNYQLKMKEVKYTDVVFLGIGFIVCSMYETQDVYLLEIISTLMSGTFMSRLFYVLREKHGLTYNSNTSTYYYESIGGFVINITSDSNRVLKNDGKKGVLPVVVDLLNDLVENGIKPKEMEYIKKYMEGQYSINTELSAHQVGRNGKELLLRNNDAPIPYKHIYREIFSKITLKDVNAVIKKYFTPQRMNVCIWGADLPTETAIRKQLNKFSGK